MLIRPAGTVVSVQFLTDLDQHNCSSFTRISRSSKFLHVVKIESSFRVVNVNSRRAAFSNRHVSEHANRRPLLLSSKTAVYLWLLQWLMVCCSNSNTCYDRLHPSVGQPWWPCDSTTKQKFKTTINMPSSCIIQITTMLHSLRLISKFLKIRRVYKKQQLLWRI